MYFLRCYWFVDCYSGQPIPMCLKLSQQEKCEKDASYNLESFAEVGTTVLYAT